MIIIILLQLFNILFVLSCPSDPLQCYYLLMVNETSSEMSSDLQKAWTHFNCTLLVACTHPIIGNIRPRSCTSMGNSSPPARQKRLASIEEAVPITNKTLKHSVINTLKVEAIFLDKYMKLDDEDKHAIGHRSISSNSKRVN
jgi:hypothetical protein